MRFSEGAAVIGPGWVLRLGRLRLIWAAPRDPLVTKVVLDEPDTWRMTITWQPPANLSRGSTRRRHRTQNTERDK